eukprot:scaffold944_cov115-Alexandrium_tamarense.AAC.6
MAKNGATKIGKQMTLSGTATILLHATCTYILPRQQYHLIKGIHVADKGYPSRMAAVLFGVALVEK